jgi:hypothetical protein
MSILVDLLGDADLAEFAGIDSYTKRSLQEFAPDVLEDEDAEDDYEE